MNEKKKLVMHRLIWLVIVLVILLVPIIITATQPKLALVGSELITAYDDVLDASDCLIEFEFNRDVLYGTADIKFFDASNNLIDTCECYFRGSGNVACDAWMTVTGGEAKRIEVVSYDFRTYDAIYNLYWLFILIVPMFISALLLSYKEYNIDGRTVSVYSGFYHHTLRVDGEIYDEHNTLITFTPIKLSTTLDNTKVEATISLTNRIAVKADDKICK